MGWRPGEGSHRGGVRRGGVIRGGVRRRSQGEVESEGEGVPMGRESEGGV